MATQAFVVYDAADWMRDNWKAARVGVMVLLGIAASVFVYRYVDERATGEQGYSVYALFSDAQGLIPKSRVVVAGISVGYIEEIQLQGAKARVDIHINDSIILHEDAAVAMRSVSILGESILVIRPGTAELAVLGEGDQISTVSEATTTDEILSNVNDIAINVKAVTKQLARSFGTDEAGERLEGALRDVSEALETVNRVLLDNEPVIGRTLQNVESATAEAGPRLVRILDNVEAATLDVRELVRDNRDDLDGALTQADETVAAINRSAHELEQVLQDVGEVTDRTARGEGTVGRLTSDDVLIDEVEGAAEGINNLVGGLARLRTVVELRSEYNFLANTFKTYLGIRLQPAEDRYYFIQFVDDPRGSVDTTQTTVRTSPPREGDPSVYQETRIARTDALRFSLLFAKQVNIATFRFGIIESTGGLGADIHLLDERFELNLDAFALGERTFPRLRARLGFEVVDKFWVQGGIDDALNEESRDFFLGAMLRFDDSDLAAILALVGGSVASAGSN